ncbi:MAG: hypothetical protein M3393_06745 [Actinomycetota bacterium]|nr:hypothetical protein [Actinomycetota bacterium]
MPLAASCPRCSSPVSGDGSTWRCLDHAVITPLWRPSVASYEAMAEHLRKCDTFPTLLPWPLSPGWSVTDFGCVGSPGEEVRATAASCAGASDLDGVVELSVISEEPGVGLGARCAGVDSTDPGDEVGDGPPHAKVRLDGHPISLWSVSTCESDQTFDRSVLAGEAHGRWLWLVLRPAAAALLLNDEWILLDVSQLGPELVDLPFGGTPSPW